MGGKSSKEEKSANINASGENDTKYPTLQAILIGNERTGKTTLAESLLNVGHWSSDPAPKRLDDYIGGTLHIDGKKGVQLRLFEPKTSSHKRLSVSAYAHMHGIVAVYSVQQPESLEAAHEQLSEIHTFAPDVPSILVGTGVDAAHRKVKRTAAEKVAKEFGARYAEVGLHQESSLQNALSSVVQPLCHYAIYGDVPASVMAGAASGLVTLAGSSKKKSKASLKSSKYSKEVATLTARPLFEVKFDSSNGSKIGSGTDGDEPPELSAVLSSRSKPGQQSSKSETEELDPETAAMIAAMEAAEAAAEANEPAPDAHQVLLKSEKSMRSNASDQ